MPPGYQGTVPVGGWVTPLPKVERPPPPPIRFMDPAPWAARILVAVGWLLMIGVMAYSAAVSGALWAGRIP